MYAGSASVKSKPRRENLSEKHRFLRETESDRVGRLPPEVKVDIMIDMTDAMVNVCAEGMKAQNPRIVEEELIKKLRERFEWTKQWQKRGGQGE